MVCVEWRGIQATTWSQFWDSSSRACYFAGQFCMAWDLGSSNSCKASRSRMINHCTTITIKLKWYVDKFSGEQIKPPTTAACIGVSWCKDAKLQWTTWEVANLIEEMDQWFQNSVKKITMLMLTALCCWYNWMVETKPTSSILVM